MRRVPHLMVAPLRLSADAASASSELLARYAELLRVLAGEQRRDADAAAAAAAAPASMPVATPAPARARATSRRPARSAAATAPPGGADEPTRSNDEEHTLGRTAGERKEPTPEPARGASA